MWQGSFLLSLAHLTLFSEAMNWDEAHGEPEGMRDASSPSSPPVHRGPHFASKPTICLLGVVRADLRKINKHFLSK